MVISLSFLEALINSKIMKVVKVEKGDYYYEYAQGHYKEGTVFGVIEIDNPILDTNLNSIGYFGIAWGHNILVYYLL